MALVNQLTNTPSYTDFAFVNKQGADIAAGLCVSVDATNAISATNTADGIPVLLPSADGQVVIGVTMETLKAGGPPGRVRCFGPIAVLTATNGITAGGIVMSDGTGTPGQVKAQTAAKAQLGIALSTAAAADAVLVMLAGANNA